MKRGLKAALVVLSGAAMVMSTGCVSTLAVRAMQPARVNFGAAKQLVVIQSEGRRSAREELIAEVQKQARGGGHFTATDRSEEGITMKAAGRNVNLAGAAAPQGADEIWVRIDVLEWDANRDSREEPIFETDKKTGERVQVGTREVKFIKGKALIAVTASNAAGKALLAETEYESSAEGETEEEARVLAGKKAIAQFLGDITPLPVVRQVRLDEDDKGQEKILKIAKDGNINAAISEMRAYLAANPGNPSAQYNLAVFLDAAGSYGEALDMYNAALRGSTKDYYAAMKAECQKRNDDAMALSQ